MATINGTENDDVLNGTNLDDTITGNGLNDTINAGNGNDTVYGDYGPNGAQPGQDATALQMVFANRQNESADGTSVEYRNIATLDDGTPVLGRLSVVSKSSQNLNVDLTGGTGAEILLNRVFNSSVNGETVTIRLEFFNQNTGAPISLNSTATFGDLDRARNGTEKVEIGKQFITEYGVSDTSNLNIQDGASTVSATGGVNTNPSDQDSWFSTAFENQSFLEFTLTSRGGQTGYTLNGDLIDDPVVTPTMPGDDIIDGGNGDDRLFGQEGNDTITGGEGNDTIEGGEGDDTLDGGGGQDVISGGSGDDVISGGNGDDRITGDEGNDTIDGGTGQDVIEGGDGDDSLQGGQGDDRITGGDGNDNLQGGQGQDQLDGGAGDDVIAGDDGNDRIEGGAGNDQITGGAGQDQLSGGDDADTFFVTSGSDGNGDRVDGGTGGDDRDVLDLTGAGAFRFQNLSTDADGDSQSGRVEFLDSNGNITGRLEFTEIESIIPCFTTGTRIATPRGEIAIENLQEGDRVITRDSGMQEIRWIGQKTVKQDAMQALPHLKPVLVRTGSLGSGLPQTDLLLSPNHRVLMMEDRVGMLFEDAEVLSAVKHMTDREGIDVVSTSAVTYWHILFDNHEVILSNGAWTESFQPGDYSLKGIGDAQRKEVLELFPQLTSRDGVEAYQTARMTLKKYEAKLLTS